MLIVACWKLVIASLCASANTISADYDIILIPNWLFAWYPKKNIPGVESNAYTFVVNMPFKGKLP